MNVMGEIQSDYRPSLIEDELEGDVRSRVKAELAPGERLLWSARPLIKPTPASLGFKALRIVDAFFMLMSMGLFVTANRSRSMDVDGFLFAGWLALFAALLITWALLASWNHRRMDLAKRSETLYALTDRRAIVWIPDRAEGAVKVQTFARGTVSGVHRVEYPDGSGDILFRVNGSGLDYAGEYWGEFGILGIADVRTVEEQVLRTLTVGPPTSSDSS